MNAIEKKTPLDKFNALWYAIEKHMGIDPDCAGWADDIRKALRERQAVDVEGLKSKVRAWRYPDGHSGVPDKEYMERHKSDGELIDHLAAQGYLATPDTIAVKREDVPDGWTVKIDDGKAFKFFTETTQYKDAALACWAMHVKNTVPCKIEIWRDHLLPHYGPYTYIIDEDRYSNTIAYIKPKQAASLLDGRG